MLPTKRIAWLMSAVLRLIVIYFAGRLVFFAVDIFYIMYHSAKVKQLNIMDYTNILVDREQRLI